MYMRVTLFAVLLIGVSSCTLRGAEPPDADPPPTPAMLLEPLRDSAFDHFVSIEEIQAAYTSVDPAKLADTVLLLSHGESALLRPHRSGITANKLLAVAARAAIEKQDRATLERLVRVAAKLKNTEWEGSLQAALKISAESRQVGPNLGAHSALTEVIQNAKLLRDTMVLEKIEGNLPKGLSTEQQGYVKKLITQAKASMPKAEQEFDSALDKLRDANRAIYYSYPVSSSPISQFTASPSPTGTPGSQLTLVVTLNQTPLPGTYVRFYAPSCGLSRWVSCNGNRQVQTQLSRPSGTHKVTAYLYKSGSGYLGTKEITISGIVYYLYGG